MSLLQPSFQSGEIGKIGWRTIRRDTFTGNTDISERVPALHNVQ
jgi:hypothetical protein